MKKKSERERKKRGENFGVFFRARKRKKEKKLLSSYHVDPVLDGRLDDDGEPDHDGHGHDEQLEVDEQPGERVLSVGGEKKKERRLSAREERCEESSE